MQSTTSIVLSTLHAAQAFMTTHADALGHLNSSSSRSALDAIEQTLSEHAQTQAAARNGGTSAGSRLRVARDTLVVKYLRPIAAISEAQLSQSPDFATFKLPKNTRSVPSLVAAANGTADAASKYADAFISAGMKPTFVADLKSAVIELVAAEAAKGGTKTSRMGATSALEVHTKQAHKVIKQLDALIEPQLANDPALLVKWKATKRFSGKAPAISAATSNLAPAGETQTQVTGAMAATAGAVTPVVSTPPATAATVTTVTAAGQPGSTTAGGAQQAATAGSA